MPAGNYSYVELIHESLYGIYMYVCMYLCCSNRLGKQSSPLVVDCDVELAKNVYKVNRLLSATTVKGIRFL